MKRINPNVLLRYAVLLLIIGYGLFKVYKHTTTGNEKADVELNQQKIDRPKTGEIDFK